MNYEENTLYSQLPENRDRGELMNFIYLCKVKESDSKNNASHLQASLRLNLNNRRTIGNYAKDLKEAGFIDIQEDGRKKLFVLTEKGEELYQIIRPLFESQKPDEQIEEMADTISEVRSMRAHKTGDITIVAGAGAKEEEENIRKIVARKHGLKLDSDKFRKLYSKATEYLES